MLQSLNNHKEVKVTHRSFVITYDCPRSLIQKIPSAFRRIKTCWTETGYTFRCYIASARGFGSRENAIVPTPTMSVFV